MQSRLLKLCDLLAVSGLAGLLFVAILSMLDVALRTFELPRVYGLDDLRGIALALIVASCFPYGLMLGNNVTVKILRLVLPETIGRWLPLWSACVVLVVFFVINVSLFKAILDMTLSGRTTATLQLSLTPWAWCIQGLFVFALVVQASVVANHADTLRQSGIRT